MNTKKSNAGTPPKKTGTPTYVKLMMILCSLSSLYSVISKCVIWKDSKLEFICTIPDLSGTPSRTPSVGIPANGNEQRSRIPAADEFVVESNVEKPSAPQFYQPRTLLEYTEEDSIQSKIEGLKEFILQTSLDNKRLEAAKNPQIRHVLTSFLSQEYLFRPACLAIENLANFQRARPYLAGASDLVDAVVSYIHTALPTLEVEANTYEDINGIPKSVVVASVVKGLDVLIRFSSDSSGAKNLVQSKTALDTLAALLVGSNNGFDLKYKVAGILSNLAVPDNLRNDVLAVSDVMAGLSYVVSSHADDVSMEARSMAATAIRNLAVTSYGQQVIGSTKQAVQGVAELLTDANTMLIENINEFKRIENNPVVQSDDTNNQLATITVAINTFRNVVLNAVAALENLSAFEGNRALIIGSKHSLSTLCQLLLVPTENGDKESLAILSHAVGTLANLAQISSTRILIANESGSIVSLLKLIAAANNELSIEDKASAVMGNIAMENDNIPAILQAIVDVLKPELPENVKLLALNLANTFAGLSEAHKSLLLQTPLAIESLHGLYQAPVGNCPTCASSAQALLVTMNAFP